VLVVVGVAEIMVVVVDQVAPVEGEVVMDMEVDQVYQDKVIQGQLVTLEVVEQQVVAHAVQQEVAVVLDAGASL
jgi:hypothetical protein